MQHVQDTLRHAADDANQAIHNSTLGMFSLFNAWAMGTRAMANGIIATVESMTEQSRMAWEQGQQATQHFSRMGQPGQPAQPGQPRQAAG